MMIFFFFCLCICLNYTLFIHGRNGGDVCVYFAVWKIKLTIIHYRQIHVGTNSNNEKYDFGPYAINKTLEDDYFVLKFTLVRDYQKTNEMLREYYSPSLKTCLHSILRHFLWQVPESVRDMIADILHIWLLRLYY